MQAIPKEKIIIRRDSSSSGPSVAYETITYLMVLRYNPSQKTNTVYFSSNF
jgi:hypothetical protein